MQPVVGKRRQAFLDRFDVGVPGCGEGQGELHHGRTSCAGQHPPGSSSVTGRLADPWPARGLTIDGSPDAPKRATERDVMLALC